jgi:hypothetical protein
MFPCTLEKVEDMLTVIGGINSILSECTPSRREGFPTTRSLWSYGKADAQLRIS